MVLYRFLFAPVLLVVAVLTGSPDHPRGDSPRPERQAALAQPKAVAVQAAPSPAAAEPAAPAGPAAR